VWWGGQGKTDWIKSGTQSHLVRKVLNGILSRGLSPLAYQSKRLRVSVSSSMEKISRLERAVNKLSRDIRMVLILDSLDN